MPLIDIGVNLTNTSFTDEIPELLRRAQAAGVTSMIVTGTSESDSIAALALANTHNLYCTAGVHPHDAKDVSANFIENLRQLATQQKVVAIGECGLDFNRNYSPQQTQQRVFAQQLELALDIQLPVFLHERDAFETQKAILLEQRITNAVAHCFTANKTQMKTWLDMGFYIGITGWLCDQRRGADLRDAVRYLPLDRLLLETDAPYLQPRTLKSKTRRNEPAHLHHIAKYYAQLTQQPLTKVIESSYQNTLKLFAI